MVADGVARPNVRVLYGREAVLDVEMRLGAGAYASSRDADAEIERLGLSYGIATRMTSFVAVDTFRTVDPTKPTRREIVRQALPFGMTAEGAGLRPASVNRKSVIEVWAGGPGVPRAAVIIGGRDEEAATSVGRRAKAPAMSQRLAGKNPPISKKETSAHKKVMRIEENTSLRNLAQKISVKPAELLAKLWSIGMGHLHINSTLDTDTAKILASEHGWEVEDVAVREDASLAAARGEEEAQPSLVGRLKKLAGNAFTIEVTLAFEIELAHGALFLLLATGQRLAVVLDVTRSTAPGTYGAGMVLRFVGTVQGFAPSRDAIRALEVEGPFGALLFRIS